LLATRPDRFTADKAICLQYSKLIYQILYQQNKKTLGIYIKDHRRGFMQYLLEKLKLAQHAYQGGHTVCWNEARVLQIEPNIIYIKYKESAHMSLLVNPI
jgi:hypothetical protein